MFNQKLFPLYLIGLFGTSVDLLSTPALFAHESAQPQQHDKQGHNAEHTTHPPKQIEIPANQPVPKVNLIVHPDRDRGWNLEIQVENFAFTPAYIGTKNLSTEEGHAHLYVNGKKITRLYGSWYYLAELPPGKNVLTVTLNTNGHEALLHNGQPIQATQILQVPQPQKQ